MDFECIWTGCLIFSWECFCSRSFFSFIFLILLHDSHEFSRFSAKNSIRWLKIRINECLMMTYDGKINSWHLIKNNTVLISLRLLLIMWAARYVIIMTRGSQLCSEGHCSRWFLGGIQWNMVEGDETRSKYVGSGVEPNLDKTQPSRNGNF